MNSRILALALGAACFAHSAFASCPSPFVAKDGTGTSQNLASVNNGSNNCEFPYVIGDGGGATNFAAVKAASTAAVAGDPALAVTMSPNTASVPVTPPANQSVNLNQIGGSTVASGGVTGTLLVEQGCAGQTVANTSSVPFSFSSTGVKIISGISAKKTYICSINVMINTTAGGVALVEGTGSVCATSITGMAGGTSASTGWVFAANGQVTMGNGQGVLVKTAAAADDVCLLGAGSGTQVSGFITYAQF